MGAWDSLSIREKADMMKAAIRNGITTLPEIKQAYNEFAEGGNIYDGTKPHSSQMQKKYIYDVLPGLFAQDGVKISVTSGYRPGAVVRGTNKPSRHGLKQAADIVGDFDAIRRVLDDPNSNTSKWLLANGYGYLDETSKTGTSKFWHDKKRDHSHYHIGTDSGIVASYAKKMQKLLSELPQQQETVSMLPTAVTVPEFIPYNPQAFFGQQEATVQMPVESVDAPQEQANTIQSPTEQNNNFGTFSTITGLLNAATPQESVPVIAQAQAKASSPYIVNRFDKGGSKKSGGSFYQTHRARWFNFLREKGVNPYKAERLASYFSAQDALESGYGTSSAARQKNNYGGMQRLDKKTNKMVNVSYGSIDDYMNAKWKMMNSKYSRALNAKSIQEYANILNDPKYHGKGYIYGLYEGYRDGQPLDVARQTKYMNNYTKIMMDIAGEKGFKGAAVPDDLSIVQPENPYTQFIPFEPFNPQVFNSPQAFVAPTREQFEVEQPIVEAAKDYAYSPEQLEKEERRQGLNNLSFILGMMNGVNGSSFADTIGMLTGNIAAEGGKIHIKPENRGKFTALKKRTGHSATWFKEHGTPAQRKMATFALNAAKWKHGYGGNLFETGGDTVGEWVNALYQNNPKEEYLGEPSHHYDFTQTDEWADAHGYYPDDRGHRDDRVKKPAHPSHPSRGVWDKDKFILTDKGIQDSNYILFGLNDGGQDPQANLVYRGGNVVPEITVTPRGNYVYNPYDNIKLKYKYGGHIYDGTSEDTQQMDVPYAGELPDVEILGKKRNNVLRQVTEHWVTNDKGEEVPTYWGYNPTSKQYEQLYKLTGDTDMENSVFSTYDNRYTFNVPKATEMRKAYEQWVKNGANANGLDEVMVGTLGLSLTPIALPEIAAGVTAASDVVANAVAATPWGQTAIEALSTPLGKTAINTLLAYPGLNNFFSSEGYQKTANALNEGRYGDAALSAVGDALDLSMAAPLAKNAFTAGNYISDTIKNLYRNYPIRNYNIDAIIKSDFYNEVSKQYGKDFADDLAQRLTSKEFRKYLFGDNPRKAYKAGEKHLEQMEFIDDVENAGGLLGGSGQLARKGTVKREGLLHDLDFFVPGSMEERSSSVIDALGLNKHNKPNLGVLTPTGVKPKVWNNVRGSIEEGYINLPQERGNITADMFIRSEMPTDKESADVILNAKRQFGRPKDLADIENFVPYSKENPIIDIATGEGQWNPTLFDRGIFTEEGYPFIQSIETYPGSGVRVPAVMNYKGQIKALSNPTVSGTPQITAENAASMTPEQWTAAQDAANDAYYLLKQPASSERFQINKGVYDEEIPEEVKQIYRNAVLPRMLRAHSDYYPLQELYKEGVEKALSKGYTVYPQEVFDSAGKRAAGAAGLTFSDGHIAVREGYEDFALGHELRHRLQLSSSPSMQELKLLNDAYDANFENLGREYPHLKDINLSMERETLNYDARRSLVGDDVLKEFDLDTQNAIIDDMSDTDVFEAVEDADAYGSAFIDFLRKNNLLTHKKAQQFREAMKHASSVATPIAVGLTAAGIASKTSDKK